VFSAWSAVASTCIAALFGLPRHSPRVVGLRGLTYHRGEKTLESIKGNIRIHQNTEYSQLLKKIVYFWLFWVFQILLLIPLGRYLTFLFFLSK
jgi:hypothetical protein